MGKIIGVVSGSGGVGRTTLAINLAFALNKQSSAFLLDANQTNPHVHVHLSKTLPRASLQQVLNGECSLHYALQHVASGLAYLPSQHGESDYRRLHQFKDQFSLLAQHIIVDAPHGSVKDAKEVLAFADDFVLVVAPELAALGDAKQLLRRMHRSVFAGVVVNEVRKHRQISDADVERVLGIPVMASIPYDKRFTETVMTKQPFVHQFPRAPITQKIDELAHQLRTH
ncbi:MAG: AAA family ATPase [Candidatus Woesearchaeota archaeon]|nr:MAG: AAA family ATPase [Candidatus Woesearchaeota archaeon]